jgi:hypothetical protein
MQEHLEIVGTSRRPYGYSDFVKVIFLPLSFAATLCAFVESDTLVRPSARGAAACKFYGLAYRLCSLQTPVPIKIFCAKVGVLFLSLFTAVPR